MLSSCRTQICAACRPNSFASSSRYLTVSAVSSSGSNKWAKIKHKKAANDQAKSNMYGALSREIIAAVRNHPTHSILPEQNSRLAALLKKAKEFDVTKEKLEATLNKAAHVGQGGTSIQYEMLGPTTKDGVPVALIVECQSDSPGRTTAKVKEAINKHNARLSSTSHLFQRSGVIRLNVKGTATFDNVWEVAVENGAEDVKHWESDDEAALGVEIICNPVDLQKLTSILSSPPLSHEIIESEAKMIASGPLIRVRSEEEEEEEGQETSPASISSCLEEEDLQKLDNLVAALEEGADCHRVWSNVDGWPS